MIAVFHSAGVTNTGGYFRATDTARQTYEQGVRLGLGSSRLLPFIVKIQLVCKAWYKGAGRHLSL